MPCVTPGARPGDTVTGRGTVDSIDTSFGEAGGGLASGTTIKRIPSTNTDKMDSPIDAERQHARSIASRIISLALKKMDQNAGQREIGAILYDMTKNENASL